MTSGLPALFSTETAYLLSFGRKSSMSAIQAMTWGCAQSCSILEFQVTIEDSDLTFRRMALADVAE